LLDYAGTAKRSGDLFPKGLTSFLQKVPFIGSGMSGMQNIYTKHKPLLKEVLDQLLANKLSTNDYPFAQGFFATKQP
jgi:hypothetical protein